MLINLASSIRDKNKAFLQDYIENVLGITEEFNVKVNVLNPRLMIGCSNLAGESFFGMRQHEFTIALIHF